MSVDPAKDSAENQSHNDQIHYVYGFYENDEEHAVLLTLSDSLTQSRRTFSSDEDYHTELDLLMDRESLTLDASLYHRLIHALNPAEIHLLDSNGELVIGDYVHTTSEEAAHKYLIDDENQTLELVEFWGEDGTAVHREISQMIKLIGRPDVLSLQSFKNPFVQAQAAEFISYAKTKSSPILGKGMGPVPVGRYVDVEYSDITRICLPSDRAREANVSQECFDMRFAFWNQSIGRRTRSAIAGTESMVFFQGSWRDLEDEGPRGMGAYLQLEVNASGGHSIRRSTCSGTLTVGALDYSNNPPYSQIINSDCKSVFASAPRKARRGALSTHRYGFHEYFVPENRNGTTYLIYRPSSSWNGAVIVN
ncbi:MAG: hypothetical protein OXF06_07370 [Bacteroidetes bacterium]|nr:hypothetical protein [Bacteroidota bacterium]